MTDPDGWGGVRKNTSPEKMYQNVKLLSYIMKYSRHVQYKGKITDI